MKVLGIDFSKLKVDDNRYLSEWYEYDRVIYRVTLVDGATVDIERHESYGRGGNTAQFGSAGICNETGLVYLRQEDILNIETVSVESCVDYFGYAMVTGTGKNQREVESCSVWKRKERATTTEINNG